MCCCVNSCVFEQICPQRQMKHTQAHTKFARFYYLDERNWCHKMFDLLITPARLQVCFQGAVDRNNLLFLPAVCPFLSPVTNELFLGDICPLNLLVAMMFLSTTYPPFLLLSLFFTFCKRRLCCATGCSGHATFLGFATKSACLQLKV